MCSIKVTVLILALINIVNLDIIEGVHMYAGFILFLLIHKNMKVNFSKEIYYPISGIYSDGIQRKYQFCHHLLSHFKPI